MSLLYIHTNVAPLVCFTSLGLATLGCELACCCFVVAVTDAPRGLPYTHELAFFLYFFPLLRHLGLHTQFPL